MNEANKFKIVLHKKTIEVTIHAVSFFRADTKAWIKSKIIFRKCVDGFCETFDTAIDKEKVILASEIKTTPENIFFELMTSTTLVINLDSNFDISELKSSECT